MKFCLTKSFRKRKRFRILIRKDIEVLFDEEFQKKEEIPDINTYIIPFGKYKGKTLPEIKEIDSGYISWAKENMIREPVKTLLAQM